MTEIEKQQIASLVSDAETKTDCEIIILLAKRASHYQTVPLIYASLLSLPLPIILYYFSDLSLNHIFSLQFAVFLTVILLCLYEPIKLFMTPKIHKQARLNQRARDILWSHHNLNRNNKAALLIFIAQNEKMAIIDSSPKIKNNVIFEEAINNLCDNISKDNLIVGIETALKILTPHLALTAPKTKSENSIENQVFEL